MKKGIWIRNKIMPYYLKGPKLALAMLLKENPLSAAQISAALSKKELPCDPKELGKLLASLERIGVITSLDGTYSCSLKQLENSPISYSKDELIDLIGMTQGTVNGKAFYSTTPPMSVSSHGNSSV